MPALTISAVDSATDKLTIVGHGLLTGAGPAAVRNQGEGSALPAPLAPVTDYWVIVVDADHVKLATSSALALAGTPINLTTNGTGTLILELGIPYTRARTYVPSVVSVSGAQVKSGDMNSFQDAMKAIHALFTGQAQAIWTFPGYTASVVHPLGFDTSFDNPATIAIGTHVRDLSKLILGASATPIYTPIIGLRVGEVITGVVCELAKNTNNTNTVALDVVAVNVGGETASGAGYTDNSNAPGVINFSGLFNITVASGYRYYVKITPGSGITPAADRVNHLGYQSRLA